MAISADSNLKGMSFLNSLVMGKAWVAKLSMNIHRTPMVPMKACTSDTSIQGPHRNIEVTILSRGSQPEYVHL